MKVTVVGSGLVGCLLSIYLARLGFEVSAYEQSSEPKKLNKSQGRSINITLCERGLAALKDAGIGHAIQKLCLPLTSRAIHPIEGEIFYQPYGKNKEALYCIERHILNQEIYNFAQEQQNIKFYFNQKCIGGDLDASSLSFHNTLTDKISRIQCGKIFAADGAYSKIRALMQTKKRFAYSQEYINTVYKEFRIPVSKSHEWSKNALHIWPRGELMLVGFPNYNGSFTLTLHLPHEGKISHKSLRSPRDLEEIFANYFPDTLPAIKPYLSEYFAHPIGDMVSIKCFPWKYQDKAVLVGDAGHAIVPYYGQGANAGFEDCQVLATSIKNNFPNWEVIFQDYENSRKPNMDVISALAIEHLDFLQNKLNQRDFYINQKIQNKMELIFPEFKSLYYNISFTTMPYLQALMLNQKWEKIAEAAAKIENIEQLIESSEIDFILRVLADKYRDGEKEELKNIYSKIA